MILGHGIDLINENRIEEILNRYGKRFELKYFSESEMSRAKIKIKRSAFYAKCWATKEAFSKALGTGIRDGLFMRDISLERDELGKPQIELNDRSRKKLYEMVSGSTKVDLHVSIADDFPWVQASVIISYRNKI